MNTTCRACLNYTENGVRLLTLYKHYHYLPIIILNCTGIKVRVVSYIYITYTDRSHISFLFPSLSVSLPLSFFLFYDHLHICAFDSQFFFSWFLFVLFLHVNCAVQCRVTILFSCSTIDSISSLVCIHYTHSTQINALTLLCHCHTTLSLLCLLFDKN